MKVEYFCYFILISVTFFSCGDNNPVSPYVFTGSKISGRIKEWSSGNDKQVILRGYDFGDPIIYSASLIDPNGYFSLENLDTPGDSILMEPVYPQWGFEYHILHNTVVCSDSTAKMSYTTLPLITIGDTTENVIGYLSRCNNESLNISHKAGDFFTNFVFVNKTVSITGIIEVKDVYSFYSTIEYNLNYSKGWNQMVILYKSYNVVGDSGYAKMLVSNTEPWGGYWRYNPEINSEIITAPFVIK